MCSSNFCRRGVASSDAAAWGRINPFGRSTAGGGDGAAATGGRFRWNRESMRVSWWRADREAFWPLYGRLLFCKCFQCDAEQNAAAVLYPACHAGRYLLAPMESADLLLIFRVGS
jgi:hypothetical protein